MKVLHVLDHSLPREDGYAMRSHYIVCHQQRTGIEPVVLTSARQGNGQVDIAEDLDDTTYWRSADRREWPVPFVREIARVRTMSARLGEVVRQIKPDILHAHSPCLWGLATCRVGRQFNLPVVYEIRGFWEEAAVDVGKTNPRSPRYRATRTLEAHVCRKANAVVTIANGLADDLASRGIPKEKMWLVPNGVDTEKFMPQDADPGIRRRLAPNGEILIGYIGTLYPWEGIEDLLWAVPEIQKQDPNFRVAIVGGGAMSQTVTEMIAGLGIEKRVTFVGSVPHKEIRRYYSALDILVYPRRSTRNTETVTPLKPLEAMAMGKPVIGSDVGGIRELVKDGSGQLFKAGDPKALAEACIELLRDSDRRNEMGSSAREQICRTRTWKNSVATYNQVYSEAMKSKQESRKNGK